MPQKLQLQNWSKDQLIAEVELLRKRKEYGLVWEPKLEDIAEQCKTKLPVLKEVKSKVITEDKNGPTNILIEGDNHHSLSVLNYTHKKSIDVIYIDPPYNTGKSDFKFNDQYVDEEDSYRHSKWLSFMEKRLKLAKSLLKDEGFIFISIDDNEQTQLKMLCDDIFGDKNLVAIIPRLTKRGGKSTDSISKNHDYILIYARTNKAVLRKIKHTDSGFKYEDEYLKERGLYKLNQTLDYDSLQYSPSLDYEINIDTETLIPGGVTRKEMELRKKRES